jgi:hypothetical protein
MFRSTPRLSPRRDVRPGAGLNIGDGEADPAATIAASRCSDDDGMGDLSAASRWEDI